ncbi:MAG TPA: hypothetical protein VGB63_04230 [Pedobacter sp.]|jgi:hypothetical protein
MKLYIIGFIDLRSPRVLINPGYCRSIPEVLEYLETPELAQVISEESLSEKLSQHELIQIRIVGFKEAVLIGNDHNIDQSTDRFVCTGNKRFYPVKF